MCRTTQRMRSVSGCSLVQAYPNGFLALQRRVFGNSDTNLDRFFEPLEDSEDPGDCSDFEVFLWAMGMLPFARWFADWSAEWLKHTLPLPSLAEATSELPALAEDVDALPAWGEAQQASGSFDEGHDWENEEETRIAMGACSNVCSDVNINDYVRTLELDPHVLILIRT